MKWLLPVVFLLSVILLFRGSIGNSKEEIVKKLFHQMARWSTAATQDQNHVIRVLHANYGVGYMMALQSVTSDEDIGRIVGVEDIRAVFDRVTAIQNEATLRLISECPEIAPTEELAKYGGEAL